MKHEETLIGIKANLLNEEQKKLKQEIMEGLLHGLFGKINSSIDAGILDPQAWGDIVLSIIIMFTRECIAGFVCRTCTNKPIAYGEERVDFILGIIKKEAMNKILYHD